MRIIGKCPICGTENAIFEMSTGSVACYECHREYPESLVIDDDSQEEIDKILAEAKYWK
jgi:uncharacterized Zn finger protein (UPF0148 family)